MIVGNCEKYYEERKTLYSRVMRESLFKEGTFHLTHGKKLKEECGGGGEGERIRMCKLVATV